jgi:hypothetical protein
VSEAASYYFQGKVSAREVTKLFHAGDLPGIRVGKRILLYLSGLDAFREKHANGKPRREAEPPTARRNGRANGRRSTELPPIRLERLPSP